MLLLIENNHPTLMTCLSGHLFTMSGHSMPLLLARVVALPSPLILSGYLLLCSMNVKPGKYRPLPWFWLFLTCYTVSLEVECTYLREIPAYVYLYTHCSGQGQRESRRTCMLCIVCNRPEASRTCPLAQV